jgi:L,D-peptidoglycan transpeptidase YkuD (ErfK/YbiS/YcfS/YnhG family)
MVVGTSRSTSPVPKPPDPDRLSAQSKSAILPIRGYVGDSRQVITVKARGTFATVSVWNWQNGAWRSAFAPIEGARIGTGGLVPSAVRKQGSGTTPAGSFSIDEAFGVAVDPKAKIPYHQIAPEDYWVQDNSSKYYNRLRSSRDGGFRWWLPASDADGSEHLADYPRQYEWVVVINFNRPNPVHGRGSGIFLHVNGRGATAGCVSVPRASMLQILRWLDPALHPRILIG